MGRPGVQDRKTLCWFVLLQWRGWLVGQCSGAPAKSTWLCSEEIVKEDQAEDKEIDKQDKEIEKAEDKEIDVVDKEIDKVDKGIDRVDNDKEEVSWGTWIQVVPVGNCDRAGFAQFTICLFLVRGPSGVGKV